MESFIVCLNAVLPIFLLMAAGYAARCFHLLDRVDVAKINKLVFRTFLPVMVFNNIFCIVLRLNFSLSCIRRLRTTFPNKYCLLVVGAKYFVH